MIAVAVDVEYAREYWVWLFPGTENDLVEAWKSGRYPDWEMNLPDGDFDGELLQLTNPLMEETWNTAEHSIHSHMEDDSALSFRDQWYPHRSRMT